MNYPGSFTISHFWSLSVEEQFYLIWAPLMYLFRKYSWLLLLLVTGIGIATMLWEPEIYKVWFGKNAGSTTYYATYSRFMYFGAGGILAYFIHKQEVIKAFFRVNDTDLKFLQWGLSVFVVVESCRYLFRPIYHEYLEERFINAALSTALVLAAITRHSAINLEFNFLKYLGKISFGIYVFHFLAIRFVWLFLEKQHVSEKTLYLLLPILSTVLAIVFAALSYQFMEKWFLKQKDKFKF
jgi:peptidoglycan/LPS O-acetylase OafA/YrhL